MTRADYVSDEVAYTMRMRRLVEAEFRLEAENPGCDAAREIVCLQNLMFSIRGKTELVRRHEAGLGPNPPGMDTFVASMRDDLARDREELECNETWITVTEGKSHDD